MSTKHLFGCNGLIFLLLSASSAYAQFSGSIEGIVRDPSGGRIPRATLTLLSTTTNVTKSTTSDADGNYRFVSLAPGEYQISAKAQGFSEVKVEVSLRTSQTLALPLSLPVASAQQVVEVTGEAPVLNAAESRNQQTLETQELHSLPLAGRNMLNLVTLAPGVTGLGTVAFGSPGSAVDNYSTELQVDASANGRNLNGNMYILDGLDVTSDYRQGVLNLVPNPDVIQEASIQTNTFSVEYGRASSIQMVMTTRSGAEKFHGAVSDYFTSQQLWAGTEFVHKYQPFHSNNMSATIGGPIIPHRDRAALVIDFRGGFSHVRGPPIYGMVSSEFPEHRRDQVADRLSSPERRYHRRLSDCSRSTSRNLWRRACATLQLARVRHRHLQRHKLSKWLTIQPAHRQVL